MELITGQLSITVVAEDGTAIATGFAISGGGGRYSINWTPAMRLHADAIKTVLPVLPEVRAQDAVRAVHNALDAC
jgi:hypothetical protein